MAGKKINYLKNVAIIIFPVCFIALIALALIDLPLYKQISYEDGLAEWLTFIFLMASAVVFLMSSILIKRKYKYYHPFLIICFLVCFFGALEEISWGQRVFGFGSNDFFMKHNQQEETNAHNIFQKYLKVKTKHIAALIVLIYAVILPVMKKNHKLNPHFFSSDKFIFPPAFLRTGFILSIILLIDVPTSQEEEYGELFCSLAIFLLALHIRLYEIKNLAPMQPPIPDQSAINTNTNLKITK